MTRYFQILILALAALIVSPSVPVNAQVVNLPVVELLGGKYYVYTAKKGDSLFGIARKYGWDDKKLAELNASAVSPLKKGMLIYYPVAENMDKQQKKDGPISSEEVVHKIKRGETVYAIANMYGVSVDRIYSLNPDSRNGIKAGETLIIKKGDTLPEGKSGNENGSIFYTVKSGDTLYKLARTYGVSVAAIMQDNPGVDEKHFKSGSMLKIPKRGTGVTTKVETVEESNIEGVEIVRASKNDTWSTIASKNGIDEQTLKDANPTVTEIKNKDYIAVPKIETTVAQQEVTVSDPREKTSDGISEIYDDIHNLNAAIAEEPFTVRVAVVSENPSLKKDAEFLRGFLTAIDKHKRDKYKISFKVLNAADGSESVIESLDEFKPTIVFTTSETELPAYLCEYAYASRTSVVNTFDVKSEAYTDNPYVVQLLTPSLLFNDNVAHYISKRYEGYKLLLIGTEDKNDQLAESLLKLWDPELVKRAKTEAVVPAAFRDGGKYLIYAFDVKKPEVSALLERVDAVQNEKPLAYVEVFGRPNLILFEESMFNDFKKVNLSIPSRFYVDKESPEYTEFLQRYKLLFKRTPTKSVPLYAAVGYDTANYFIPALAKANGDINCLDASRHTVQSDYDLWRPHNWSGFLNPPVYIIDYTEYDGATKNVVSYKD